jgi:hypothetical protein
MEKLRFETDPHNRLIVSKTGSKGNLTGFRQVLDGEFKIGADNTLSYNVKAPLDENALTDRQVKFSGKWGLNADHDLVFTLDSWQRQVSGDELTLRCQLVDATGNTLVTSISTRSAEGNPFLYMLTLQGSWQADKQNRLTFLLNSRRADPDILTFGCAWEVNDNFELLYRCQKEGLAAGKRTTQTLLFKGSWDIRDKARLTYQLSGSTGSLFDFKASVGVFKDNYIKYEVGIGAGKGRSELLKRVITFFGSWKISPSSGLIFELEKNNRKTVSIALSAQAKLSKKDTVIFTLKNRLDRSIGAELELSRKIVQGSGEAFIKLLASKGEQGVYIGTARRW